MFEQYVRKYFADWKGKGKTQPVPDFGKPDGSLPTSAVLVEPGIPATLSLGWLRPWRLKDDTIVYNQEKLTDRSEEHTSELQSLMRISYAVFCLKKKKTNT